MGFTSSNLRPLFYPCECPVNVFGAEFYVCVSIVEFLSSGCFYSSDTVGGVIRMFVFGIGKRDFWWE